jgi:hypothetical protein
LETNEVFDEKPKDLLNQDLENLNPLDEANFKTTDNSKRN